MLVDSHCHLDFPDFADELDAVVGRARDADIGRIVTISTRVARHAGLLAIAERFPDVFCSVGTHPHNAHEELDVTAEVIRQVAILAQPVMPVSAGKLLDLLGVPADARDFARLGADQRIAPGTQLPAPAPVFPRYVEPPAEKAG